MHIASIGSWDRGRCISMFLTRGFAHHESLKRAVMLTFVERICDLHCFSFVKLKKKVFFFKNYENFKQFCEIFAIVQRKPMQSALKPMQTALQSTLVVMQFALLIMQFALLIMQFALFIMQFAL